MRIIKRIKDLWYRAKCFVWNRYSTVRAETLPHTWVDRSHLLPHIMFQILTDFLNKECNPGPVEWYGEFAHKITVNGTEVNVMDEMKDLVYWWHEDYLKNYDTCFDYWHDFIKDHSREEDIPAGVYGGEVVFEWVRNYDTPENEQLAEELFKNALDRQTNYDKELMSRMCRLVNVSPYMWT